MHDSAMTVSCPKCDKSYKLNKIPSSGKARCHCGHTFDVTELVGVRTGRSGSGIHTAIRVAPSADAPAVPADSLAGIEALAKSKDAIMREVGKVIVGQKKVLEQIMTAFFAQGHCLLMGVPGLAKTLMVQSLAKTMLLKFKRIQFTPDLMPTDITGTNILEEDPESGRRNFTFHRGPIFTNVLLADEINRTPPKTQAALLEAMQERRVTTSGKTHALPAPFLVLATQNPLELEGTYPLPEAQLDRFIFLVKVDYPQMHEEQAILQSTTSNAEARLKGVVDAESILRYQNLVRQVPVSDHVASYAARLCRATRPGSDEAPEFVNKWVRYGCGPRAGQSLILAAKAHVVLNGRFNVSCQDIREYALPVLRHRLILNFTATSEGLDSDDVIKKLLETVGESE